MQAILALKIECVVKGNRENTKQITNFMFTKSLTKKECYLHWKFFNKTCNFDNNLNTESLCPSISAGFSSEYFKHSCFISACFTSIKLFKK